MPVLPDIPPLKPKPKGKGKGSPTRADDSNNTMKVALRTEEEQQAAAREREREERERAAREKQVKDHREARRKSLANRRVSFAAEATLHTFHDEYAQDSTASTESTSARRASSIAVPSPAPSAAQMSTDAELGVLDRPEVPESPLISFDEPEDIGMMDPLCSQKDMQQNKRRRSSTGASMLSFRDPNPTVDDNTITSTVYDSDGDGVEEDDEDMDDAASNSGNSDSDSDEGDGATMVTVDADEITSASMMSSISMRSASPIESTTDIDEALRMASQHAGAQADQSRRQRPLDDDEEVIPAFIGWGKKATQPQLSQPQHAESPRSAMDEDTAMSMDMDMDMDVDMEITRPMGGIIKPAAGRQEDEMSMDVTRVYGGILLPQPAEELESIASSPMIMPDDTVADVPMDMTTALGAIHRDDAESLDSDGLEDMSMELTTVLGGVLGRSSFGANKARRLSRRQTIQEGAADDDDGAPMDITIGVGNIIGGSVVPEKKASDGNSDNDDEGDDDEEMDMTMGMEITTALGSIIKPVSSNSMATPPKTLIPHSRPEVTAQTTASQTPTRARGRPASPQKSATKANPQLYAFTGKGLQRTPDYSAKSATSGGKATPPKTPTSSRQQPEPATKPSKTPSKAPEPSTPQQTSPMRFIGSRSKSPKRKAASAQKSTTTPRSPPKPAAQFSKSLFAQNATSGSFAPFVVLTPQGRPRQSAFVGAGPASPKITEIFSRRSSLVDAAAEFVPGSAQKDRPAVAFEMPSRQSTPEAEGTGSGPLDDREATQSLKDLIHNLSPKKNPFKGRKSLHVGSARGLLGKRPFELDDDEEEEENDNTEQIVKRLKGPEPSPVKNIRLQQPPSAMETIGRSSRSQRSPSETPMPGDSQTTPRKNAESVMLKHDDMSMANDNRDVSAADGEEDDAERIHLQDFLKLANINFMELDTTKRRATEGPGAFSKSSGNGGSRLSTDEEGKPKDPEIESLVIKVCKVPLLEMYQHACRELKNYIEEGRSIMREIESETYEDNPPIFREYTAATPGMRTQMDNQFKNIKIFARLQSKKQWYEWRAQLHQGLHEGMVKTLRDLEKDKEVLHKRREEVDTVYPGLLAEYEALERECTQLETFAEQLGGDDQESFIAARVKKGRLTESISEHKSETARLEDEMKASKARVAAMKTEREQYLKELEEAKKIREERRSWSHQEISSLKTQVDALEKKSGWAVTGAQGTTLSLAYRREIELVFDVAAFRPGQRNAQIDLWYIGHTRTHDPQPCTPEAEFFLQCIRDHVRALRQCDTHPGKLLKVVRASWDTAKQAANQIRHLSLTFPTTTRKTSDTSLAVVVKMVLVPLQTKVEITLHLRSVGSVRGLRIAVASEARVVYGEPFNAAKMGEFLAARIGNRVSTKGSARASKKESAMRTDDYWVEMLEELKGKLLARGRR